MLAQAAGFALLAAISPTALLVAAVYLGSASPRLTGLLYLVGAVVMSVVMATVVLLALQAGHFRDTGQHQTRYGLRLGLGILALAAGLVITRRGRRQPDPGQSHQGFISRMAARPGPVSAFASGVLLFAPGITFIAAVQVIATSKASLTLSLVGLAVVVVIYVASVWLPYLCYLIAPAPTTRRLKAFNAWLRAHGQALLAGSLVTAGALLTLTGVLGLTGVA